MTKKIKSGDYVVFKRFYPKDEEWLGRILSISKSGIAVIKSYKHADQPVQRGVSLLQVISKEEYHTRIVMEFIQDTANNKPADQDSIYFDYIYPTGDSRERV